MFTLVRQSLPTGVCPSPGLGSASGAELGGRLCVDNSASQASSLRPLVDAGRANSNFTVATVQVLYFNKSLLGRCTLPPGILNSQDWHYCKSTTLLILQISYFQLFYSGNTKDPLEQEGWVTACCPEPDLRSYRHNPAMDTQNILDSDSI